MISPYVSHRHPDFWDHPEGFDPERFAGMAMNPDGEFAGKERFTYFPFGVGPHLCIGRPFFDAIDDIVDAFDDLAPLIRRERAFGDVDFGDRHETLFLR